MQAFRAALRRRAWGAPGFGGIEDILGDLFGLVMCLAAVVAARVARRHNAARIFVTIWKSHSKKLRTGMTAQLRIPRLESCETCKGSARLREVSRKLFDLQWHWSGSLPAGLLLGCENVPRLSWRRRT
jgi:DnaJ-class molecular chaperone